MFTFQFTVRSFAFLSASHSSGHAKLFGKADFSKGFSVGIPFADLMFNFLVGELSSIPFGLDEVFPFGHIPGLWDSP